MPRRPGMISRAFTPRRTTGTRSACRSTSGSTESAPSTTSVQLNITNLSTCSGDIMHAKTAN
eukprot:4721976-Prymnesium_polylepis.1